MRPETTPFIAELHRKYNFQGPIVDLGGCETDRQFKDLFDYQVWDKRDKPDVDKVIDITEICGSVYGSVGTLITVDTLEHIPSLYAAINNIGNIVRSGGHVVVAIPWAFPYHDPSGDYWRLSHQALEMLFDPNFERLESGYYGDEVELKSELWKDKDWSWGKMKSSSYYVGRRRV